jgi:hypothetical protein
MAGLRATYVLVPDPLVSIFLVNLSYFRLLKCSPKKTRP